MMYAAGDEMYEESTRIRSSRSNDSTIGTNLGMYVRKAVHTQYPNSCVPLRIFIWASRVLSFSARISFDARRPCGQGVDNFCVPFPFPLRYMD